MLRAAACLTLLLTSLSIQARAADPPSVETPTPAPAPPRQDEDAGSSDIEELRRQLEILAVEVERLRSGEAEDVPLTAERRRALGLAPSAAATYRRATDGLSFAGYGEMLAENHAARNEAGMGGAPTSRIDFLRAILYAGYRFDERFVFNSEIEVEHGGEIFVEFAYVDYLATDNLTVRGGLLLIPLGLVNEFHEPTVFLGARRPETEQRIIPSTWRENGAGILGSAGPVDFRAYVTNGFNGAGFSAAGLRGGRQKGIQANAAHLAFSGRLDVTPMPGVFAGVGLYHGGSGQEQVVLDGEALTMGTTVVEVHGQAQMRGFDVRALVAHAAVDEAGAASAALGLAADAGIADAMLGGYVQVGYDVLSQRPTAMALTPYVRLEHVDTQHGVPAGFVKDLSRDGHYRTLGLDFKPIPNVVVKVEHQWIGNEARTGRNQFNVNLGYAF